MHRRFPYWVVEFAGCFAVAGLVGAVIGCIAAMARGEEAPAKPDQAVKLVLDKQVEAWNRGDLEGFMAGYWKSEQLLFFSGGTITKGWDATIERYRKRYQADGKEMGKLVFSGLAIEALSNEAAYARGRWKVVTSKETFEGLFTVVMRRIDGKWVVVHDHTSAADPPKPAEKK